MRNITKLTFQLNPEDSTGVGIIPFYDNVTAAMDLDPSPLNYDCTKINVARNIQENIYAVLDAESSEPCYTAMMWVLCGPKTYDDLPNDTVEIFAGFFLDGETPLPLRLAMNTREAV